MLSKYSATYLVAGGYSFVMHNVKTKIRFVVAVLCFVAANPVTFYGHPSDLYLSPNRLNGKLAIETHEGILLQRFVMSLKFVCQKKLVVSINIFMTVSVFLSQLTLFAIKRGVK